MFGRPTPPQKSGARRALIREKCPDSSAVAWLDRQRCNGAVPSLLIVVAFWLAASAILMMREDVLPYRPGQTVRNNLFARVDFSLADDGVREKKRQQARADAPRVYRSTAAAGPDDGRPPPDGWQPLEDRLRGLPDAVAGLSLDQLPPDLKDVLDSGSLTALQSYARPVNRHIWAEWVAQYLAEIRGADWTILPADQRAADIRSGHDLVLLGDPRLTGAAAADRTVEPGQHRPVAARCGPDRPPGGNGRHAVPVDPPPTRADAHPPGRPTDLYRGRGPDAAGGQPGRRLGVGLGRSGQLRQGRADRPQRRDP